MPTTSNFGWTTPADTDLVKDGAAAIRTLGNGIDTSLVDLKGGTTGQILSKNSNTDLDYTWINNDQGDITEVQAGTGISVASGTGPVPVVTNTVATTFDAKGDLVVGTGADTFAKLTVGTNDYVLTAASGETTGLKWAAPAGYAQLASGDLWTSGSSLTISSISGSYNKLVLVIRDFYSATEGVTLGLQWNSTGGATAYQVTHIYNSSVSAVTTATSNTDWFPFTPSGIEDAQSNNIIVMEIENYADSSVHKVATSRAYYQRGGDTYYVAATSVSGAQITAAVSSIKLMTGGLQAMAAGNYVLYGVK